MGAGGPPRAPRVSLAGLLGAGPDALRERLGEPDGDRSVDGQRWMVYELDQVGSLRCRLSPRLSSWSLSFDEPLPPSLAAAARAVGLWPELRPDAAGRGSGRRLIRRAVTDHRGRPASATALAGPGGIVRIALFDEAPEW